MTVGLGENTARALNALVPVSTSGGGRRPCARGLSIRTSQFRIRRLLVQSSLGRFARPFLHVRSYGRYRVLRAIGGHRVRGLDLHMGPLVMCIG